MLNTYIDYEAQVLEESAEWTLSDPNTSYIQAFIQTMDKHLKKRKGIDPKQINYPLIFDELGVYIGSKSQIELLQVIEESDVHVFGAPVGSVGWKKHLKNKDNIYVYEAIPFNEAI